MTETPYWLHTTIGGQRRIKRREDNEVVFVATYNATDDETHAVLAGLNRTPPAEEKRGPGLMPGSDDPQT